MSSESGYIGWLKYNTKEDADTFIGTINNCLGFPTPDGRTTTWAKPQCYQNDYEGSQTESGWFVVIRNECYDCLTQTEKDNVIDPLPYDIPCGLSPISGTT